VNLPHSDALVFFGATGDLIYKKIFPALYAMERRGHLKVPVIGVARSDWTIEKFRARALASVKNVDGFDAAVFAKFQKRLRYISGDYSAAATHAALRKELSKAAHPLHFLAIPPSVFAGVIKGLGQSGCARGARIILEKPFGRDLPSAQALARTSDAQFRSKSMPARVKSGVTYVEQPTQRSPWGPRAEEIRCDTPAHKSREHITQPSEWGGNTFGAGYKGDS
jgi:Glucose-6-phosphate 1-dehydrogenase